LSFRQTWCSRRPTPGQRALSRRPGRIPSGAELASWVSGFGNNVPHEAVAGAFLGSAENSGRLVSHWYGQFLQRAPDDGGLSGFAQALQSGVNESAIRNIILSSDEYFADHSGTAAGFVQGYTMICSVAHWPAMKR